MRLVLALVLASLLCPLSALAQTAEIDSMRTALVEMPADTSRVITLQQLSLKLFSARSDSSLAPALEAEKVARRLNFWRGIMLSLYAQGVSHYGSGHYEQALTCYEQALELAEGLKAETFRYRLINNIGVAHNLLGNYPEALKAFNQCLELAPGTELEAYLPKALMNIGNIYSLVGDHESALDYYQQGIASLKGEWSPILASFYMNMESQCMFLDRPVEALRWGRLSLSERIKVGNPGEIARGKANLASSFTRADLPDSAAILINEALPVLRQLPNRESLVNALATRGTLELNANQPGRARTTYQEGLAIAQELGDPHLERKMHKNLGRAESVLNNHADAVRHLQRFSALEDSLAQAEKHREIANLNAQHEAEIGMALLEQRLKNRNTVIVVVTVGVFLLAAVLGRLYIVQRAYNQSLHQHADQLESQVAERTEKLRKLSEHLFYSREEERRRIARDIHDDLSQALVAIRLHLTSIQDTTEHQQTARDIKTPLDLSAAALKESSRLIQNLRPMVLEDLGLAGALQWLGDAHTTRHGRRVDVESTLDCPCGSPCDDRVTIVLFRIAQEALQNIAKHSRADRVDLRLYCQSEDLLLTVHDNGQGFVPGRVKRGESFGLLGMEEATLSVGGTFNVTTGPDEGTRIQVRVPRHSDLQAIAGTA